MKKSKNDTSSFGGSGLRTKSRCLVALVACAFIAICSHWSLAQAQSSNATAALGDGFTARPKQSTVEAATKETRAPVDVNSKSTARTERRVFVRSESLLVRGAVVEDKLLKRPEFHELGFVITRQEADADVILELRHDLFTKYVFSVIDTRSQVVLASGKLSSLGGTVAGKVAKRFVKEMRQTLRP